MAYRVMPMALQILEVFLFLVAYRISLSADPPISASPHLAFQRGRANFFRDDAAVFVENRLRNCF